MSKTRRSKAERERAAQMAFWRRFKRHSEMFEANRHLEAYRFERDPLHILRGVFAVASTGRPLSKVMLGNFRHAIDELAKRAKPSNMLRDIRIVQHAMASNGGSIPKRLHPNVKADIARSENIDPGYVSVILSRFRARMSGRSR
jgi:hypothetical protein